MNEREIVMKCAELVNNVMPDGGRIINEIMTGLLLERHRLQTVIN